jgi:hypothetical protein
VFESVEAELLTAAAKSHSPDGALARFEAGLLRFLEAAASSREVQQILLIDGPAVLGWKQWRKVGEMSGLGAIRGLLDEAVSEGAITPQPLDALAHILLAAVAEAALYIANARNAPQAKEEALAAMERLLNGVSNT